MTDRRPKDADYLDSRVAEAASEAVYALRERIGAYTRILLPGARIIHLQLNEHSGSWEVLKVSGPKGVPLYRMGDVGPLELLHGPGAANGWRLSEDIALLGPLIGLLRKEDRKLYVRELLQPNAWSLTLPPLPDEVGNPSWV
ncbi:hypothetical protein E6R60_26750 [Streptomyces sp. A0642]|uniref:hypothetical protein n=1 Tax=Streptomyces sp. A0642 TaxID=2563100 RepID=UPI0010A28CAF|nr:hypothetical protein [Streptomyces sp. A0642]THA72530.1 hypothetical protein E6R60_26750 [Streptomyces sp. A0642]